MRVQYQPAEKQCFEKPELHLKFCVYRAQNARADQLLYLFHGRNLDEQIWNDDTYFTGQLQKQWQEQKQAPPTVVGVSFGPVWLLTPKNQAPKSGLMETFVEKAMPEIEKEIHFQGERRLLGESMGGLNSLILSLQHPELFTKVASLCAPVYTVTPFSSWSEIWHAIKYTGADPRTILGIIVLAKNFVSTLADWQQIDPISLLSQRAVSASAPKYYLSAGLYDKYGLFEGVSLFVSAAKAKSIPVEWHPLYGGHCAIDVDSLASFLIQ